EAGCTATEIMAVTGHKSLAEVAHYTMAVDQERMAESAIAKIQRTRSYPHQHRSYPPEKKA
ncbi:MAG: hypothetical protein WAN73_12210, partial [Methyloceanibacter sp.]